MPTLHKALGSIPSTVKKMLKCLGHDEITLALELEFAQESGEMPLAKLQY